MSESRVKQELDHIYNKDIIDPTRYTVTSGTLYIIGPAILIGKPYQSVHDKIHAQVVGVAAHCCNGSFSRGDYDHISENRRNK
jgi:hypothetical protein